ncbi:MAG: LytS/YhcK type 5TM receptor domain-containing protein, partial [Pseudomonadota bacterium]
MFQGYLTAMMDLAGSLSVICLLSLAYGSVRRRLPGVTLAPQLLGALFGFVAVLQMHTPISPVPGMIIDLRVVPIVLAGAFLGGRGVLICLMIAVAGRAAIGGVGVSSGIVSMMLAGGAGLAWDRMTTGPKRRGGWTMAALVAMTSVNFVAVVMLPYELMMWFLTWAFAPLLATYAVTIPLVGTLLERERVLMASEARLRAAAQADPETGFPSRATLETQLSQALANGLFDRGVAVLRMTFKPGLAQASFWGDDVE